MKVKRIAVYRRVSTDAQSHAGQLREARASVRRRWLKAEVTEYLDKVSGAEFSREGLDALMAAVPKGRVDVLTVHKLDRLGRSLQQLAQLIGEFETNGSALVATSQGIDTSEKRSGRVAANARSGGLRRIRAQRNSRTNQRRARRGKGERDSQWQPLGCPRKPHQHRAAVAKLVARGMSGRKIAEELKIPAGSVFAVMRDAQAT